MNVRGTAMVDMPIVPDSQLRHKELNLMLQHNETLLATNNTMILTLVILLRSETPPKCLVREDSTAPSQTAHTPPTQFPSDAVNKPMMLVE